MPSRIHALLAAALIAGLVVGGSVRAQERPERDTEFSGERHLGGEELLELLSGHTSRGLPTGGSQAARTWKEDGSFCIRIGDHPAVKCYIEGTWHMDGDQVCMKDKLFGSRCLGAVQSGDNVYRCVKRGGERTGKWYMAR